MKFVSNQVSRKVSQTVLRTKQQSPHIFFVAGLTGIITSAILACRATLKLEDTVDSIREDVDSVKKMVDEDEKIKNPEYSEREYYKDLGYVYLKSIAKLGKLYGPSVIIGTVSVAALTGSHVQLTRRNTAVTMTLAAVSKAYDEYRETVKKELGEKKELEIHRGITDETIDVDGKKKIVKVADPNKFSPYARIFDEGSPHYQKDSELNHVFIQCQQNYANQLLQARGHVFLNDVYDALGFERSRAGAIVGWFVGGDGDGYVDFGLFEASSSRFINNIERNIILDFNVDGVIYEKLKE